MSGKALQQNLDNENEKVKPPHTKSDVTINIEDTVQEKEKSSNEEIIEDKLVNNKNAKELDTDVKVSIPDDNENKTLEDINTEIATNENMADKDNKDTCIVLRTYGAYYGQQQIQYQPPGQQQQQQQQFYQNQPTMYQQQQNPAVYYTNFQNGGQYGGAPLAYDPSTRNSFVKLVLIIVLVMLLVTAAFIAFVMATEDVKDFFNTSGYLILIPAMVLTLIADYGMMCSPCARVPPCNIIFLIIAEIGMTLLAAKISAHYRTEIVLYATIATAAVVFVCVLLACSSFDFTSWMLYVVVIGTAFSVIAMIVMFSMLLTGSFMKPVIIVILVVGTLIQVVMLTIQLQTILGGRSVELSEDDYALGAFMLYTSIISLFIKMVQLIGLADD